MTHARLSYEEILARQTQPGDHCLLPNYGDWRYCTNELCHTLYNTSMSGSCPACDSDWWSAPSPLHTQKIQYIQIPQ